MQHIASGQTILSQTIFMDEAKLGTRTAAMKHLFGKHEETRFLNQAQKSIKSVPEPNFGVNFH